jgi:molecular chaperone DnaK (HSP70)
MEQISKQRKELSANQDSLILLENLIDGQDLNLYLSRSDYENCVSEILNQIRQCLEEFREFQVYEVEVVGGGSRIPAV